ncbi:MAG TPA: ABC transporter ATP-binding protein [Herpetosiphonaceae bacterium]|nr:ABC transporter ATP-binding protein [Herpetosiphonaceae bacterium]
MIDVYNLQFTYVGTAQPAVRGLDFQIAAGEVFGLLGPSGAGKSTTQKILIGLLRGYEGQVTVLGRDLRSWGQDYYERIGVSFELPNHYLKLTALENLHYWRALYAGPTDDPMHVLEQVGLAEDANRRVGQFSKGMRNRLNVARALLHRPALLFLDEPTSGLDPANARRIMSLIRRQQEAGTTIFLTTHNMQVADELCDRVAFIVDGRIMLIDAPRTLRLTHGRRSVLVEHGANGARSRSEFPLDGIGDNANFLQILRRDPVETIHTQETTLEAIFLQLTGRSLQ